MHCDTEKLYSGYMKEVDNRKRVCGIGIKYLGIFLREGNYESG